MNRTAVLLLDLQVNFLDMQRGKLPVDSAGALRVIAAANAVLRGEFLAGALPVLIVNAFAPTPAIATDESWYATFAQGALRRAGVKLLHDIDEAPRAVAAADSAAPRRASRP